MGRPAAPTSRTGRDLRRGGRGVDRPPRPHRRAALRRPGALGRDRRAQAGGARSIPVLGNGDIWEASDAVEMMRRHRLRRRRDRAAAASAGRGCSATSSKRCSAASQSAGTTAAGRASSAAMTRHVRLLVDRARFERAAASGEALAMRDFRKHTNWYVTGYPVGPEVAPRAGPGRRSLSSWTRSSARSTRSRDRRRAASASSAATANGPIRVAAARRLPRRPRRSD